MSTTQATSSPSLTDSKHKRRLVPTSTTNTSRSSTTKMPRPLHLALGSVVGSSSSPSTPGSVSPCPSPGPSRTSGGTDKQPTTNHETSPSEGDGDGDASGILARSSPAETPNTSRAPSPSPLSPAAAGLKRHSGVVGLNTSKANKRSSISYIPSNGTLGQGPFTQRSSSSIDGFARSPLSSTHPHPPASFFGAGPGERGRDSGAAGFGNGLARSNSLGSRGPRTPSTAGVVSAAAGLKETNGSSQNQMPPHLKERPPATLSEKHAELLHFIAQKESKCLELRSQLAIHEAELLQLKRKWERIVNRGFEKSMSSGTNSTNPPSASTVPLSASLFSTSPTSPTSISNNASSSAAGSYFPSLGPAGAVPGAVVLEGIKGGVQGMSRLIAAGIESIVLVNGPTPSPSTPSQESDASSVSHKSVPQRIDVAHNSKHWNAVTSRVHGQGLGHGQKESQSSSSTTASSSTMFSSSSLFSTSSTATSSSSASESINGSTTTTTATKKKNSTTYSCSASASASASGSSAGADGDADADESEFGEFEEGRASLTLEVEREDADQDQEQVLMVDDTGATPTMSPNPHFRRRRRKEEEEEQKMNAQIEKLVLSPPELQMDDRELSANSASVKGKKENGKEKENAEFDWDDGWDEPVGQMQVQERQREAVDGPGLQTNSNSKTKVGGSLSSPVPAPPTIPGLSALNMGTQATTQQMSSWVGSVGKKWDEIKGSPTFTKSQKRASLLLTDMQNSIVSALISPPPSIPAQTSSTSTNKQTLSSFSSNASHNTSSSSRSPKTSPSLAPPSQDKPSLTQSRSATSLLDDSDGELYGLPAGDLRRSNKTQSSTSWISAPVMIPDSLSPSSSQAQSTLRKGKSHPPPAISVSGSKKTNLVDDPEDEWNW